MFKGLLNGGYVIKERDDDLFNSRDIVLSGCLDSPGKKKRRAGLYISMTTHLKQLPQINIDSIHVFTFTSTHTFQLFRHFHRPAF